MEPARTIVALLGGEAKVARIAGVSITAPYRWQASREKGGTGGAIPHWHVAKLLEHAEANGIAITPASFAPVISSAQPERAA